MKAAETVTRLIRRWLKKRKPIRASGWAKAHAAPADTTLSAPSIAQVLSPDLLLADGGRRRTAGTCESFRGRGEESYDGCAQSRLRPV